MTPFRELLENASSAINNLKHPNIKDAVVAISDVLYALGHGYLGNETVDSIELCEDGDVCINTSYTSKGWADCDSYTIPAAIVDAPNPVRAATESVLRKELEWAIVEVTVARNSIPKLEARAQDVALKLAEFLKEPQ